MSAVRAVLFDMGYTLLAPHPSFEELVVQTAARHDVELTVAAVRAAEQHAWVQANHEAEVKQFTLDDRHSLTFWSQFYERLLRGAGVERVPADLPRALYQTFTNHANYEFYPDVWPALDQLAARGFTLGVISNWEMWLQQLLIDRGVHERFACVVISGVVGFEKPDVRIFQHAFDVLGMKAEQCAYVGDSLEHDVAPSLALGVRPYLIDRKGRGAPPSALPCTRITSLHELLSCEALASA
jgi:putative hydrolase of the HAD superfamily